MITYVNSSITNAKQLFILHGCNCQGYFNAGVAKAIRNKWPQTYTDYMSAMHEYDKPLLGKIVPTIIENNSVIQHTILSAFTQNQLGWDGKKYVSYDALDGIFCEVASMLRDYGIDEIAMSKIGCSLGGGSWSVVEALIDTHFKDIKVYVYETK